MIYAHYTEYNSVEMPEVKAGIKQAEEELRSLVDTEEERKRYMNVAYIESVKGDMRIVMEWLEGLQKYCGFQTGN